MAKLWADGAEAVAKNIVGKYSQDIANNAKERITSATDMGGLPPPVDRGRMRGDIVVTFKKNGYAADVVAKAPHSAFLEFGTGPKGRATCIQESLAPDYFHHTGNAKRPPINLIAAWVKRKGLVPKGKGQKAAIEAIAYAIADSIARYGIAARPYLYPAYKQVKPEFDATVEKFLEHVKRKVG